MEQAEKDLEFKLRQIEYPFNWDLNRKCFDQLVCDFKRKDKFNPSFTFIRYLLNIVIKIFNENYENIDQDLDETELHINDLKSSIEKAVAKHMFDGTKAHYLLKKKNFDEGHKTLKNINNISDDIYLGKSNEFKGNFFVHCRFNNFTLTKAKEYAEKSLSYDPENATSHLVIARSLRATRKLISTFSRPDNEEISYFKKAYELEEGNPKFAMYLAGCFKENKQWEKAMCIYNKVHEMRLQDAGIQLKLGLAFIRAGRLYLNEAKECLDYVESVIPEHTMFLHYKGLYLMKIRNFEEAAKFLLKATAEVQNYTAEMSYIECIKILGKRFNYTSFYLKLKEKYYDDSENARKKEILLRIAFSYFHFEKDIPECIKYFLLAMEIEAEKYSLKNFRYAPVYLYEDIDVYLFLKRKIYPIVADERKKRNTYFSADTFSDFKKLKIICDRESQIDPR